MVGVAPFPDRDREFKIWLTKQDGPITPITDVPQHNSVAQAN